MRQVVWFLGSMAVSLALIFLVHHIHEHFVKTLTSPIEKNVAEDALNKYKHIYADIYADISNEKSKRGANANAGADAGAGAGADAGADDGCTAINLDCPDDVTATTTERKAATKAADGRPSKAMLHDMKNELRDFLETNHQLSEPPSKSTNSEYIAKTY